MRYLQTLSVVLLLAGCASGSGQAENAQPTTLPTTTPTTPYTPTRTTTLINTRITTCTTTRTTTCITTTLLHLVRDTPVLVQVSEQAGVEGQRVLRGRHSRVRTGWHQTLIPLCVCVDVCVCA